MFDHLPPDMPRVMSVGRLDLNSEGLLLLTNDGELKRRLELPSTGWLRKYRVRVKGNPTDPDLEPLRKGITVEGERFQPMDVTLDRHQGANAWLTVGLREGKNREIRRAMTAIGLTVNRLIRVSYGPFRLGELQPGEVEEVRGKVLRDQLGPADPTPRHDRHRQAAPRQAPRARPGPAASPSTPGRQRPAARGAATAAPQTRRGRRTRSARAKPGTRRPAQRRARAPAAAAPEAARPAGRRPETARRGRPRRPAARAQSPAAPRQIAAAPGVNRLASVCRASPIVRRRIRKRCDGAARGRHVGHRAAEPVVLPAGRA